MKSYQLYDRNVDIVAAFEALFTEQAEMSSLVVHFERFPKCAHADGNKATPDFTVIFRDGIGLAVEISNLSLYESSVDKLCKQLLRYDGLTALPDGSGGYIDVEGVDVLCLLPSSLGNSPLDRIFGDRYLVKSSLYSPSRAPIIGQFSRDADKYSFLRSRDPRNGNLRAQLLHEFIDGGYGARGDFWTPYKAKNPFMNDDPPSLYLACFIWLRILPTMFGGQAEFEVTVDEVVFELKSLYGWGTKKAVRDAFDLLLQARFVQLGDGRDEYTVRRPRRSTDGDDFAKLVADRAYQPQIKSARSRRRLPSGKSSVVSTSEGQYRLFDTNDT